MSRTRGSKNKTKQVQEVGIVQLSLQMLHTANDLCAIKMQLKGFSDYLTSLVSDINKVQGDAEKKNLALNAKLHEIEKLVVELAGKKSDEEKAPEPNSDIN